MKSPTPDKEEQEEVIPLLKRTLALLLLLSMASPGQRMRPAHRGEPRESRGGQAQGTQGGQDRFGDYPEDDSIKGLIKTRSDLEMMRICHSLSNFQKARNWTRKILKIKVLKQPGEKLIEEFNTDELDPSWKGLKSEFTSNSDFHGFYDPGDYKIQCPPGGRFAGGRDADDRRSIRPHLAVFF